MFNFERGHYFKSNLILTQIKNAVILICDLRPASEWLLCLPDVPLWLKDELANQSRGGRAHWTLRPESLNCGHSQRRDGKFAINAAGDNNTGKKRKKKRSISLGVYFGENAGRNLGRNAELMTRSEKYWVVRAWLWHCWWNWSRLVCLGPKH